MRCVCGFNPRLQITTISLPLALHALMNANMISINCVKNWGTPWTLDLGFGVKGIRTQ